MRYAALLALVPAAIVFAQAPVSTPRPSWSLKICSKGIKYKVSNVTNVWLLDGTENVVYNDLASSGALSLHPGDYILRAQGYRGQQVYISFNVPKVDGNEPFTLNGYYGEQFMQPFVSSK